jgi:hypothetical protein
VLLSLTAAVTAMLTINTTAASTGTLRNPLQRIFTFGVFLLPAAVAMGAIGPDRLRVAAIPCPGNGFTLTMQNTGPAGTRVAIKFDLVRARWE